MPFRVSLKQTVWQAGKKAYGFSGMVLSVIELPVLEDSPIFSVLSALI